MKGRVTGTCRQIRWLVVLSVDREWIALAVTQGLIGSLRVAVALAVCVVGLGICARLQRCLSSGNQRLVG